LKPENLLFESKEPGSRLKLIDFGLSKIYSMPATKSGLGTQVYKMTSRVGTPFYIAPEVIRGNYDSSCDMW
jgi:calcium-dependent protein kinase